MENICPPGKDLQKGFTIIELVVSISLLAFGVLGVYSAFVPVFTSTYNLTNRLTAAYLAQEGVEIVRNLRDNNFLVDATWSSGLTGCSLGCQADYKTGTAVQGEANQLRAYDPSVFLKINSDGFYSYDTGSNTLFKRKITVTQESGTDILKVVSEVAWIYNTRSYSFQTEAYLYNWN